MKNGLKYLSAISAVIMMAMIAAPVFAQQDWPSNFPPKPEVRLIAAQTAIDQQQIELGIHIRLGPEWKTYGEKPGRTGIPPKFDWSGSDNLKSARVQFPEPSQIAVFGGKIIGYRDEIVFPVKVEVVKATQELRLRLDLSYAICADLCVPLKEQFSLTLPPGAARPSADAALLRRFISKLP